MTYVLLRVTWNSLFILVLPTAPPQLHCHLQSRTWFVLLAQTSYWPLIQALLYIYLLKVHKWFCTLWLNVCQSILYFCNRLMWEIDKRILFIFFIQGCTIACDSTPLQMYIKVLLKFFYFMTKFLKHIVILLCFSLKRWKQFTKTQTWKRRERS